MTYRLSDRLPRNRMGSPTPASRLAVSVAMHMAGGGLLTVGAASALSGYGGLPEAYTGYVAACYALVAFLMTLHLDGHAPHAHFGSGNRVTLARGMIASLLGGAVPVVTALDTEALWVASTAALLALVLDGADGWVARRSRMASAYGQHLDMNFDTVMMGILALLAWQGGKAGPWILAIGLARYIFVAAGWVWPWLNAELPFSQRRRVICVVQIAALLVCLTPLMVPPVSSLAAVAALGLLLFSFAVDTLWLVKAGAGKRI